MLRRVLLLVLLVLPVPLMAEITAVDIYSQEQLLRLIRSNTYLKRVKADDCQIVQDIQAHAEVLKEPLYQFLWGEMLNYGVCVKVNSKRGIEQLKAAAEQGSPEAMVKVANYYAEGKFFVKNKQRAVEYVYPAAMSGDLPAQMLLVKLFGEGYGSPQDYYQAYRMLYNQTFSDTKTQQDAEVLLARLAKMMPQSQLEKARRTDLQR